MQQKNQARAPTQKPSKSIDRAPTPKPACPSGHQGADLQSHTLLQAPLPHREGCTTSWARPGQDITTLTRLSRMTTYSAWKGCRSNPTATTDFKNELLFALATDAVGSWKHPVIRPCELHIAYHTRSVVDLCCLIAELGSLEHFHIDAQ